MLSDVYQVLSTPATLGILAVLFLFSSLVYNKYCHGLGHIPGPAVAAYSNIWRFLSVRRRDAQNQQIRLHAFYGKVVRLGPKTVSIADPAALQTIYAPNAGFVKSDFYKIQQTISKGKPLLTLFTTLDERAHAQLRRGVSNAYAMSTLVHFEPLVDSTTKAFLEQLDQRFAQSKDAVCNFHQWLQWFAFDVIGELTFSKRLGFLDGGDDVDGMIASIEALLDYAAPVGQMPFLDNIMFKNPLRLLMSRLNLFQLDTYMVRFARARLAERSNKDGSAFQKQSASTSGTRDFLSRFIEAHEKDPVAIPQHRVLALTVANIFAGSDTTAITLRAIFYYLLRHPEDMGSLLAELDAARHAPAYTRTDGLYDWNQVRQLPFLDAMIKEALRCHPAAGLMLERVTPVGGADIAGTFIPGGTIVGCNAWVIHRDKGVFGDDAEIWRPRRWIDADPAKKRKMESGLFSFGMGARTCIGKNISLLEIYKVVPAVLTRFELELAEPKKEWKLRNSWFVRQSDFFVRLRARHT